MGNRIGLHTGHEAFTAEEKLAIEAQLQRLLATSFFSHSRRFPAFLRYVVEKTLAGETEQLKERTLGIEIFGKGADYDTANDPIVRVTAAEIRKRIAQYYQEPGREQELRLSLPPGSYIPQFHPPGVEPAEPETHAVTAATPPPPVASVIESPPSPRSRILKFAAAAVCLTLLTFAIFLGWRYQQRSAFEVFWNPILASADPVLFCVADQPEYTSISLRDADNPSTSSPCRTP